MLRICFFAIATLTATGQGAIADTLYAAQLTQDGGRTSAVINRFGHEGETLGKLSSLDVPIMDLAYDRGRDQLYSLSSAQRFFDVDIRDGSLTNIVSGGEIGIQTHQVYGMALDADGLPVMHILAGSYGGSYPAIVSFSKRTGEILFGTEVGGGQIAIDRGGDFYITVPDTGEVKRFSPTGEPLGTWVSGLATPADLVFDKQGNLYVSEIGSGLVKRFDSTGTPLGTFASGLSSPIHMAFDSRGELYVVDGQTQAIERFSPTGTVLGTFARGNGPIAFGQDVLRAGDADQDLDFDQFDIVRVLQGGKYLSGAAATWGEGDWNGGPGGVPGNPPVGDGVFDQLDVVAALDTGGYMAATAHAALAPGGELSDDRVSLVYHPATGEVAIDPPGDERFTSVDIVSAAKIFTGKDARDDPICRSGAIDADCNAFLYKAVFGGDFGQWNLGQVAQAGLSESFLLSDLRFRGTFTNGGEFNGDEIDLLYIPVPEPPAGLLLAVALVLRLRDWLLPCAHIFIETWCHER